MIDALYSYWAFNNVNFATDLQYSVSIYFLQNIFKVHCTIGFSPQDMRQLLNHAWSTFSWCYYGTSIHFLMPLFSWNHFTLLDPRNCSTLLESKNYSIKEQLFFFFLKPGNYSILLELWLEPGNYSASLKSRNYSIFVGSVSRTRELLSFY